MGHSREEVFKHYISQSVKYDVQSAYLGIESRAQLISAAERMILSRDRRAPTELSSLEKREVDRQDQVVDLRNKRARLIQLCQTKHVTLEQAQVSGGILARKFHVADQTLRNEVRYQRSQRLKKKKEEFFATINVLEIQNQLIGSPGYCVSSLPTSPQHYLLKRIRLACKLFESTQSSSHSEQTVLLRLSALHDLIQLCARQEPRGPRTVDFEKEIESITSKLSSSKEEAYPIRCAVRTCLFCLGNVALPRQYRQRNFSSGNRLAKHLENQHYMLLRRDPVLVGQIPCPHPVCSNILEGIPHFQNHAAKVHGVRFTRSCGQSAMTD
jgi:hypothetical protein